MAFFIFRYGRIDWLESNNEYWLERDARLRTDFHIESGFQSQDMQRDQVQIPHEGILPEGRHPRGALPHRGRL